jgi:protein involved in polysaccharide export with SLBB domain
VIGAPHPQSPSPAHHPRTAGGRGGAAYVNGPGRPGNYTLEAAIRRAVLLDSRETATDSLPAMPARRLLWPLALCALAGAAACSDPPPSEYPTQQVFVEDTTLGPGDIFEVRVYQQADMSNTYSASSEGTISFPLIGVVEVTGKTPAQVESEIRARLADGFLVNPQVSLLVKEYRSKKVSVLGQVRQPGTLNFADGMTIIEAVSQAGGFTAMARKNAVTVTRGAGDDKATFTVPVDDIGRGQAANFFLRPGDVIFVPERLF